MSEEYTIEYFERFFSEIPENKWIVCNLRNEESACCALGHLGVVETKDGREYILNDKAKALGNIFKNVLVDLEREDVSEYVTEINDCGKGTPKERILNKLKEARELRDKSKINGIL